MTNFLFWNIAEKCDYLTIENVAKYIEPDFLILAENCLATNILLQTLNNKKQNQYRFCCKNDRKITILTKLQYKEFKIIGTNSRYLMAVEIVKDNSKFILFAVHLPSKLRTTNSERIFNSKSIVEEIIDIEKKCNNKNSIVVGDFNMNPFEDGMVLADAFNAVMSVDIASKTKRRIKGKDFEYFYNPMWGHFGDVSHCPSGTYYYNSSDYKNKYHWNIFDQLLIRPNIISNFDINNLSILDSIFVNGSKVELLQKSRSVKINLSDHLPLNFWINL